VSPAPFVADVARLKSNKPFVRFDASWRRKCTHL